jgi:RHS repeat-associated protein
MNIEARLVFRISSRRFPIIVLLLVLLAVGTRAQSALDGFTPASMAPGAPAGSYALSGFDNINLYNGNLNFRLPLLKVGGRGGARYTMMLPIEQHWHSNNGSRIQQPTGDVIDYSGPDPNWWDPKPGYGPGMVLSRSAADFPNDCDSGSGGPYFTTTLTRLTFIEPGGTEHELIDQQTRGAAHTFSGCSYQTFSRGTVFVSDDATGITFISDPNLPLGDDNKTPGGAVNGVTGNLMFPDGTLYRVDGGNVSYIRDRNGNLLSFGYETDPTTLYKRVVSVTDSLDRSVTVAYANSTAPFDQISYSGFGGAPRVIKVWHGSLGSALRSGSLATYAQLFPEISTDTNVYNPGDLVSSVVLPNGKSYQFRYNQHAELARLVLPTGGAIEYDHTPGSGVVCWVPGGFSNCQFGSTILRRTVARRVYPDGATLESQTTYSLDTSTGSEVVTVDELNPQGTALLRRSKHYFFGAPPVGPVSPVGYSAWTEGREYRSESIDTANCTPSTCATVLRRVEETWRQPAAGTTWPLTQAETNDGAKPNDPEITQSTITLADTNQVSKQTFSYDSRLNRTDVYEYDFGAGTPGGLLRRTHTDFLTVNSANGLDYSAAGVHIRDLPASQWVSADDAATNKVFRVDYSYDQFGPRNYTSITGHDGTFGAGYVTRGNLTGLTRYANPVAGTGPVRSYLHYDIAGNVVSTTDPDGNTLSIDYDDSFCNDNAGCGGTFTSNTHAFATLMTSDVPDVSADYNFQPGTFGSTSALTASTVYDFWTGHIYSTTDANNNTTIFEYTDPLDRLTAEVRPGPNGGRTDINYSDVAGNLYLRVNIDLDSSRRLEYRQYLDGLGRGVRTFTFEGQDANNPWLTTDTQYDALGRAWEVSDQYRSATPSAGTPGTINPSGHWTQSTFDALGRVSKVKTTADGAFITVSYTGNTVTVTDQHDPNNLNTPGHSTKSVTDALGRVTDVYEDPASASANYRTAYVYNPMGNLLTVTQGGQTRTFVYDSLSRLKSVTNPESGTTAYEYYDNGNLHTKTDANGVTATYSYDHLNRNIITAYSGESIHTPTVYRYYDSAVGGLGHLYRSEAEATAQTTFTNYDELGRSTQYEQKFRSNNAWSGPYTVKLQYNRAGLLTSETYPSQHVATYNYDAAGRPGDNGTQTAFSGNLGDGAQRTYASSVLYDQFGGMSQERFGTDAPLYHKILYNSRGQLAEIRLGTAALPDTGWQRGAIINQYSASGWGATGGGLDNNGNLRRQEVFIPNFDGPGYDQSGNWASSTQSYSYDALNRLSSASETSAAAWTQSFAYDRWGNRTIDASGTSNAPATQFDARELAATNRLYAPDDLDYPNPADSRRRMRYDAAGRLVYDSYTGAGTRTYDAENRMTSAQTNASQSAAYTYDADGKRVKRNTGAGEVWQVYGLGGELLAEYAADAPSTSPLTEYGYRGGQLLIKATASGGWGPVPVIHDNPLVVRQTVVQSRHITELRDAINALRLHKGLTDYSWQADASVGALITAGPITEMRQALDEALGVPPGGYAPGLAQQQPVKAVHIQELRDRVLGAWQGGAIVADVRWLVTDHLRTPRIVVDKSGSLLNVKRHDYFPFGEVILPDGNWRTTGRGYGGVDGVRQEFTGSEGDEESGLDYMEARYHSPAQGRFTSPDPSMASASLFEPQSWNRYSYCLNNPYSFIDPTGMQWVHDNQTGEDTWVPDEEYKEGNPYFDNQDRYRPLRSDEIGPNGRKFILTSANKQKDLIGKLVYPGEDGLFHAVIEDETETNTNTDTNTDTGSETDTLPIIGGLNPFYHPIPWNQPNLPRPWPEPPPTLRPMEPPPPLEQFPEKWSFTERGVERVPTFDPTAVPSNASTGNRIARAIARLWGQVFSHSEGGPTPPTGGAPPSVGPGPVIPFMINLPQEIWCPECRPKGPPA